MSLFSVSEAQQDRVSVLPNGDKNCNIYILVLSLLQSILGAFFARRPSRLGTQGHTGWKALVRMSNSPLVELERFKCATPCNGGWILEDLHMRLPVPMTFCEKKEYVTSRNTSRTLANSRPNAAIEP